jgi:hypothetical protein
MHTGDVVHLFEGKRRIRSVKRDAQQNTLNRAWTLVTNFAAAVAEVARESRALEKRLLDQGGYRRFVDR